MYVLEPICGLCYIFKTKTMLLFSVSVVNTKSSSYCLGSEISKHIPQ